MEIHVHNGVIRSDSAEVLCTDTKEKVVVFNKLEGLYVRFAKKKNSIIVGTLSPMLKSQELDLYKKLLKNYRLNTKTILKDEILYGVVYGKGVKKSYDAPNNPIMCFYDLTIGDKHLSFKDFTDNCMKRVLPTLSVLYDGVFEDKYKGNYVVRPIEERPIMSYNDLYRRLHWHS